MVRLLICFLIGSLAASSVGFAQGKGRVLPFNQWKQKKLDEAKNLVTTSRRDLKKVSNSKNLDESVVGEAKRKAYQAELNLGLMKALSGNDYLVLYVFPQFGTKQEALAQAVKSLKPSELVDVMAAYQEQISAHESEKALTVDAPVADLGVGTRLKSSP